MVWIGNWGDEERTVELDEFLVRPAIALPELRVVAHGVRYPDIALQKLVGANIEYRGYLPNIFSPQVYAESVVSVHIPRRQYANGLAGIPTIRVFEALACGIPLVCSPWVDEENLFRPGEDYLVVRDGIEMTEQLRHLRRDGKARYQLAENGLKTIRERHTCAHRAARADGNLPGDFAMKIFVFGSSITSSYWNGAATYYRGIYKQLHALGLHVTFAEPDAYGRLQNRDAGDFST